MNKLKIYNVKTEDEKILYTSYGLVDFNLRDAIERGEMNVAPLVSEGTMNVGFVGMTASFVAGQKCSVYFKCGKRDDVLTRMARHVAKMCRVKCRLHAKNAFFKSAHIIRHRDPFSKKQSKSKGSRFMVSLNPHCTDTELGFEGVQLQQQGLEMREQVCDISILTHTQGTNYRCDIYRWSSTFMERPSTAVTTSGARSEGRS